MHVFLIKDDEFLEKYNEALGNVKPVYLYSDPAYNEKYLNAKIKSYNGKTNTIFRNNKTPREGS